MWRDESLFADPLKLGSHTADDARRFGRELAARLGVNPDFVIARLRRRALLHLERTPPADQRRRARLEARRQARTRANRPRLRAGHHRAGRLRAAAAEAVVARRSALGKRHVGRAVGRNVSDSRRLGDGLPLAAAIAHVVQRDQGGAVRLRAATRWKPACRCRSTIGSARSSSPAAPPGPISGSRCSSVAARRTAAAGTAARVTLKAATASRTIRLPTRAIPRCRRATIRRTSSAPRCASSRAAACSTSSCRRLDRLEDYLELVTAIEDTSAALAMPVVIEGYLPPHDARIDHIKVTPDPGVIEVNVHPAHNWDELVDITTSVYEDARLSRLGTEKFDLDGTHTGTGGGNHVVLRRADAGRQPVPAPARSAAEPGRLLAQSSVAVVFALGHVHRPDEPVAARRRRPPRFDLRARHRVRAGSAGQQLPAVARGPRVPALAGRRHGQHASLASSASTSCFRRIRRPAAWAWSSFARSRCRPTRG